MEGFVSLLLLVSAVFVPLIVVVYQNKQYKKTSYYKVTKNSYSSVKYDKGKYGEYLLYKRLQRFEADGGRFLFNIYIPKTKNKTTEIDVVLISTKGLFVFESKNYGGWIFGNEFQKYWMQIFPKGRGRSHKERFYNPVMQNALHVKHLKRLIDGDVPTYSLIVFSDGCTFKDIAIKSENISVIKSYSVLSTVNCIFDQVSENLLTQEEINNIYSKLYPYSQVSSEAKEQHKAVIARSV